MPKIIDSMRAAETAGDVYIAFEYFPPRTADGVLALHKRIARMAEQKPMYADITWGAGGATSDTTMGIAVAMQKEHGLEANMHLTCTNMESKMIDEALEGAKASGIRNIVALRGDPPVGQKAWSATEGGFSCALDLVRHLRSLHGDYFGISVAGYPEGHPNVILPIAPGRVLTASEQGRVVTNADGSFVCSDEDFAKEIAYLKEKVDAGADFIITQMFFDTEVFLSFLKSCREAGITVPIMPGLMVIQSYGGFKRMVGFCKSRVPDELLALLDPVKDDEAMVKKVGAAIGTAMCRRLMEAGVKGLHFYSLNMEGVTYAILKDLGLFKPIAGTDGTEVYA